MREEFTVEQIQTATDNVVKKGGDLNTMDLSRAVIAELTRLAIHPSVICVLPGSSDPFRAVQLMPEQAEVAVKYIPAPLAKQMAVEAWEPMQNSWVFESRLDAAIAHYTAHGERGEG